MNSSCKEQWGIQDFWGCKAVGSVALRLARSLLLGTFGLIVPDLIFNSTYKAPAPWGSKGDKTAESQWDRVEEYVEKGYSPFSHDSPHRWFSVCHHGEDSDFESESLACGFSVVQEDFSQQSLFWRCTPDNWQSVAPCMCQRWNYVVLRTSTKTEYTDFLFCHME